VPLSRALRGESFRDLEVRLRRRADGREWWGSYNGGALRDESGKVVAALISMRDVTERRRAEEALRALVEERDRLLVELNHRVKNNLQLVSSLLTIQAARGGDSGTAELFEQARQRIGAIAQVHASLYQSRRVGTLEFAAYLRDLCGALADSFLDDGGHSRRVGLEVDARPLWLEADRAMPLGLIVNELVTNALKHGRCREAGAEGMVRVELHPLDDGTTWRLEVTNDGPAPVDDAGGGPARTGLGMQLVEGFARQLQGALSVERAPRYRVRVDFLT
jgi:two-component sensor histidine kinase